MEPVTKKDLLIVVPYRNREKHLQDLLEKTPKYFNQQNLTYDILISELDQSGDWNAGLCVNALIKFIEHTNIEYKYLYIHHVDIYPISGDWIFPKENEVYFNMGDYGSCLLTIKAFFDVNGYSNSFWGWGGEDNELYGKLREKQYKTLEISNIQYDTKYQSHERKFNGKNYANAIKQLMILPKEKRNNLSHFDNHAKVENFQKIQDNIHKLTVIPKQKSASDTKNDKVLLGYIKNIQDFKLLVAYVKSASLYMSYNFDMVMFVSDENPDSKVLRELEAFGVKCIKRKQEYSSLFIDRFDAYSTFLKNETYTYALHTDVTDTFFQADPFENIDLTKITLTDELIKIKEETWNKNISLTLYDKAVLSSYWENNVLCSGIIGGSTKDFILLCCLILEEYRKSPKETRETRGTDQPFLNKIVYTKLIDVNKLTIKNLFDTFAINLHVPIHYKNKNFPVKIMNTKVINENSNKKYAIVHQYNRDINLYNNITNHYNNFHIPIY